MINRATLETLPAAPDGRIGWPWTEATPPLPETMPNGEAWPRISIVTPSYNQGKFIEETIRSVLLQGHPNLEYIVIDGGSSDESVEIIKKYAPWITYWVSEKDNGQSHAINKGFARSTGEILNWLCSDDCLTQGALRIVAEHFAQHPTADVAVGGVTSKWSDNITHVRPWNEESKRSLELIPYSQPVAQPSCFYKKHTLSRPGPIDENYHYTMDLELWAYFKSKNYQWIFVDEILSTVLMHENIKSLTGGDKVLKEFNRIQSKYIKSKFPLTFWLFLLKPLDSTRKKFRGTPLAYLSRISREAALYILGFFYGHDEVKYSSGFYTFFTE